MAQVYHDAISQRTRHIDVAYHHVRDLAYKQLVDILWIGTTDQLADALTKPVPRQALRVFIDRLDRLSMSKKGKC